MPPKAKTTKPAAATKADTKTTKNTEESEKDVLCQVTCPELKHAGMIRYPGARFTAPQSKAEFWEKRGEVRILGLA